MSNSTVPFTKKVSGYSKLEGLLHAQEDGLFIEFYRKETFLNLFNSGLREKPVPAKQLIGVTHIKGWFRDGILFRFVTMEAAKGIPGTKMAEWTVKIEKKDRARAAAFVVDLELAIADQRLADIESRRAKSSD